MMSIKAFTLVSAVQRELLMGDKEHIHIACVECCGKNLYVGTNDCLIYHFLLEERVLPAGPATFTATKQLHRHLGFKKPVNELRAASALNRLLVLCDSCITLVHMLSLEPVPSGARIKGAVSFALNENPVSGDPFCVEVCIISVKRRTIQVFLVYEDRVQIVKEVSTPEQPLAVAVDGHFLCLALTTQYIILNYSTGASQDLFPYCSEEKRPIVKRIGTQEFLLAGPGGLGMFATVAGISQRAPVHWSENVIGAAVCFPYVIALDDEFITVHSMLDQQQKQTLPFKEGHILQDFEGRVIVATSKGVYILVPLPLEKQIQDLLSSRRVEEALVLAKGARRNIPKEKFQVMYRRILQQAGFIQFAQLQFLEAKELFRSGQLDVRELISLYPFLLPTSSSFTRSHPPLHDYADLNQLTQGDQEKMAQCKHFLMSYLNEVRSTEVANGYKEDIDTALLKLYAEADQDSLLDLLVTENFCLLTDSAAWLQKHKKYFALGLLYHYNNQDAAAVQLWVSIVNGDVQDSTRADLYEYIVDFLTYCLDQQLVWAYADWLLQKSQEVGVQVFTKRPLDGQQDSFNPDDIISCLKKYPKALVKYLEHLVMDRGLQKEEYHTHLALLYLDEVLQQRASANDKGAAATEAQAKLRQLLQKSDSYRVHFLIDEVERRRHSALGQKALSAVPESFRRARVCEIPKRRARACPLRCQQTHKPRLPQPRLADLSGSGPPDTRGAPRSFSSLPDAKGGQQPRCASARTAGRLPCVQETSVHARHAHCRPPPECTWKTPTDTQMGHRLPVRLHSDPEQRSKKGVFLMQSRHKRGTPTSALDMHCTCTCVGVEKQPFRARLQSPWVGHHAFPPPGLSAFAPRNG
uniref:Transforming growth factor beta receptor associated protein 1 n=1 Tax=Oryctolagus cuniculus TaxID=9986 RepID=A0A5F9CIS0_RABIT